MVLLTPGIGCNQTTCTDITHVGQYFVAHYSTYNNKKDQTETIRYGPFNHSTASE